MLERPHPAGPGVAGLDLVGDEQDPVLVAERAELAHERERSRLVAALALDRLDQDGRHARRRHDRATSGGASASMQVRVASSSSPPKSR